MPETNGQMFSSQLTVTRHTIRGVVGEFQTIRLNQPKFTAGKDFLILDMEHSTTVQGEDFSNEQPRILGRPLDITKNQAHSGRKTKARKL